MFAGVMTLLGEWRRRDLKDRAVLAVFFIPAFLSVGGLLLCVAWFVLFRLPSFILNVLGWLLLISLFSGGGLFCCEKIRGKKLSEDPTRCSAPDTYDVTAEPTDAPQNENKQKNWFDGMRNMKWPR
ncbi:MAG: hypothetical protein LBT15_03715 [Synergistaceae bacterium]|nr:hypothetical protein [Synergistaceae bacterium]